MPRHYHLPAGRCGIREFCERTGISRADYYRKYHRDPDRVRELDIRRKDSGVTHMSRAAVERHARALIVGDPLVIDPSSGGRADRLAGELRECPHCAEPIRARARLCRYCGRPVAGQATE